MPYKVLLADNVHAVCEDIFAERGVQAIRKNDLNKEELFAEIGEYDGLVVRSSTTVSAELIAKAEKLKVIGRAGMGVDNIDVPAATRHGVLVMNTPGGNTVSTAEHTCGMILALARNIPQSGATMKSGGWNRKQFMGTEVEGKTLGIVGLGKVGSEVARRMRAFGMDIIAYNHSDKKEKADNLGVRLVEKDDLLANSDFITVHTPLTEDTKNLISKEIQDKLKEGVWLINCARGGIYKEEDLIGLIDDGPVAGVALDSYSREPPDENLQNYLNHPKIITTPHLGASTKEAQKKVAMQIANQMSAALDGTRFEGILNGKSLIYTSNEDVQPYLALAEKLGGAAMQLNTEDATAFDFEFSGCCANYADVLTASVLKGMLGRRLDKDINLINAGAYAEEQGLDIRTSANKLHDDVITIRLDGSASFNKIAGAVFGEDDYRMVEIDGFKIEIRLEGDILLYTNMDHPGMLAAVSQALAKENINITSISLGRAHEGSNAVTAVCVDKEMGDDDLKPLNNIDGVNALNHISFH